MFTRAERDILAQVRSYLSISNSQIAESLGKSVNTISNQFTSIFNKMGIESSRGESSRIELLERLGWMPAFKVTYTVHIYNDGDYVGLIPITCADRASAEAIVEHDSAFLQMYCGDDFEAYSLRIKENRDWVREIPYVRWIDFEFSQGESIHDLSENNPEYADVIMAAFEAGCFEVSGHYDDITGIAKNEFLYGGERYVIEDVLAGDGEPVTWNISK